MPQIFFNSFNRNASSLSSFFSKMQSKPLSAILEQEASKAKTIPNLIQEELTQKAAKPQTTIQDLKQLNFLGMQFPSQIAKESLLKASKKISSSLKEKMQSKFNPPVSRIEDDQAFNSLKNKLQDSSIVDLGKTTITNTNTATSTRSAKIPPSTTPKIDVFTMDSSSGYQYDLDKDGIAETTHYDGVQAGLRMSAPTVNTIPKFVDLSSSTAVVSGLQEGVRLAQGINLRRGETKTDAAYFPLGIIMTPEEVGQMVGMIGLNFSSDPVDPLYGSSLNNPQVNKTVRDKLMASTSVGNDIKQEILAFEEMAKYIPVYISAGNDPAKFNLWSVAQGNNINIIGSESVYGSAVYDKKVTTDYWWTVANADGTTNKGWDIDGNGTLDRTLKAGQEGYDLAIGTKSYIYGGTSLGAGIALGKDIANNLIVDRGLA